LAKFRKQKKKEKKGRQFNDFRGKKSQILEKKIRKFARF
jgi:hypothetical protein